MSIVNPTPASAPDAPAAPQLSIWRDMWLKPRAVLRQEIASPPRWSHWLPAMLAGVAAMLEMFLLAASGSAPVTGQALPTLDAQDMLSVALLLGPWSGLLHIFVMGFLLRQLGKWFGGMVAPRAMRHGVSLALVPMAFSVVLVMAELFGRTALADSVLLTISLGVRSVLNLWFLMLLVMTVSELQQLSLRRAVLTVGSTLLLLFSLFLLARGPV